MDIDKEKLEKLLDEMLHDLGGSCIEVEVCILDKEIKGKQVQVIMVVTSDIDNIYDEPNEDYLCATV